MSHALTYPGFWRRTGALALDQAVMILFLLPLKLIYPPSKFHYLLIQLGLSALYCASAFFLHARSHQTPGQWLAGIRLARLDGAPVGWMAALRYEGVDILFHFMGFVGTSIALTRLPLEEIHLLREGFLTLGQSPGFRSMHSDAQAADPFFKLIYFLSSAGLIAELGIALLNGRRRSLADYLAGTFVTRRR